MVRPCMPTLGSQAHLMEHYTDLNQLREMNILEYERRVKMFVNEASKGYISDR